jgi:hypothetical protein
MAARAQRQSVSSELTGWAHDLPATFLLCRDIGHSWRPFTAEYVAADRQYRRTLRCSRCKADRVQRLSTSGHVESTHYEYPDDYLLPSGSGSYDTSTRDLVHLESITRLIEDAERKVRSA